MNSKLLSTSESVINAFKYLNKFKPNTKIVNEFFFSNSSKTYIQSQRLKKIQRQKKCLNRILNIMRCI